ncbi:MAG: hypothetical protein QOG00_1394, partial [Pyrinomonadaceae bacterium]|nr:hypothetical protein [Pyrinomonadaceae bacterium]
HDLCCLIQSMYEIWIEPNFWNELMPQEHLPFLVRKLPHFRPLLAFRRYRMRKKLKASIARNTITTRIRTPMNTIVLTLLGIVIIATLAFLAVLLRLSLDDADFWLKVISGVLAAFTFLAGAAALVTGTISGNRQAERVAVLEKATAEAKQKQVEAEVQLAKLRNRQEPRITAVSKLIESLKGKPAGVAEILYQEGDGEAYNFATWLNSVLVYSKWQVSEPRPIGDTISGEYSGIPIEALCEMPSPMRLGASPFGVSIVTNSRTMEMLSAKEMNGYKALFVALSSADIRMGSTQIDNTLPDGFLRIVVAQKE